MEEFSILPNFTIGYMHKGEKKYCYCRNQRFNGSHRHEVFGASNREKSIRYGLVVFIPPDFHNMADYGVHFNADFRTQMQAFTQLQAMEFYRWSEQDFINEFGKSYL